MGSSPTLPRTPSVPKYFLLMDNGSNRQDAKTAKKDGRITTNSPSTQIRPAKRRSGNRSYPQPRKHARTYVLASVASSISCISWLALRQAQDRLWRLGG